MATVIYEPKDTRLEAIGTALGMMASQHVQEARKKRELAEFAERFAAFQQAMNGPTSGQDQSLPDLYGGADPQSGEAGARYAQNWQPGEAARTFQPLQVPRSGAPSLDYAGLLESAANVLEDPGQAVEFMLRTSELQQERRALLDYEENIRNGMDPFEASLRLPPRLFSQIAPTAMSARTQERMAGVEFQQRQSLLAQEHGYTMEEIAAREGEASRASVKLTGPNNQEIELGYQEGTDPATDSVIAPYLAQGWTLGEAPTTRAAGPQSYTYTLEREDGSRVERPVFAPPGVDPDTTPEGMELLRRGFIRGEVVGAGSDSDREARIENNMQIYAGDVAAGLATPEGIEYWSETQTQNDIDQAIRAYYGISTNNPVEGSPSLVAKTQIMADEMGKLIRRGVAVSVAAGQAATIARQRYETGDFGELGEVVDLNNAEVEAQRMASIAKQKGFDDEQALLFIMGRQALRPMRLGQPGITEERALAIVQEAYGLTPVAPETPWWSLSR